MHSFHESRVINHDADLIHRIIMDIESYPKFLPWCSSATIIAREGDDLVADLTISFQGVSKSYRSQVSSQKTEDGYEVIAISNTGLFKKLENIWRIKTLKNGAKVEFSVDFEFKSPILNTVIGMFFAAAAKKMIVAFNARAEELSNETSVIL